MIERIEAHGPQALFLAFVVILGVVLTLAAVVDVARNRRSAR